MEQKTVALIESQLDLTRSLAAQVWQTAPYALELDELRAIAYYGLVDAAIRWEPYCEKRGFSPEATQYFKPYVVRRVHGALIDAIRSADWATRSLRTKAKMLQAAGQDRGLSHQELAEKTGLTLAEVRATVRGMAQRPVSIEATELDPGSHHDVESSVIAGHILAAVVVTVAALTPEQQTVLALHYHGGLQLQQVAKTMRLPDARISELHSEAVLAVHAAMRDVALQQEE